MTWLRALVAATAILLTAGCAAGTDPGIDGRYSLTLITQSVHTLPADQVSIGELVVAGGRVTQEAGATHRGTVLALAGDLLLEGTVDGDLVALGGTVTLGPNATVTGDLQVAGADVIRESGSAVAGEVTEPTVLDATTDESTGPSARERIAWLVATVALMAASAWLLVRLMPRATGRVRRTVTEFPVISGALGTLVLLTAPAFLIAMAFTIVLIPLALVLLVPLALIVAYGLIGLGLALGTLLARRTPWRPSQPAVAAWGTGILTAALTLLGTIPLAGLLAFGVAATVGTGAALLTGLGSRTYVPPEDPYDDDSET
ncbi:MAG: polymer-forming cytoskeletal protein [Dermatophilaceae bacterium]